MSDISLEVIASDFRDDLKKLEEKARIFTNALKQTQTIPPDINEADKGEYIAQSILAMRHIEDARMKYGKVIQYLGDGVSKFDK